MTATMMVDHKKPSFTVVPYTFRLPVVKLELVSTFVEGLVETLLPIFIGIYLWQLTIGRPTKPNVSLFAIPLTIDCYFIQFRYYLSLGMSCFITQLLTGSNRCVMGAV